MKIRKNIFGPIVLVCWQRSLVLPDFTVFDYPTTHEFEHSWNNTQLVETISEAFISNYSALRTSSFLRSLLRLNV